MRVTIRSIAEAANVSRGTVDKVLNNRPGVSQEVRERVKKIAEEMGYKPNVAGKALAFQKKPLRIGVIILNKYDPLFQEVYEGVKRASYELKGFGIAVECCVMSSVNVQEQLMFIRELHNKNISALVLSPLDEEIIREELKKLTTQNIKIITFNTDITGIERMCFVGQDLKKSGRVAGDLIGKLLPNGGNVLVITGIGKIKALQERLAGFKEIIEQEYPNINIIQVLENIHDSQSSYLKTVEFLKRQDSLNAIYVTNGIGTGGVGKAIQELNKRHIKFVCFDKIPETIELIKDKIVDFTITQDPFMQGYLPIRILFEYFFYNKLPDSQQIYTKMEIITKENIDI
ncbi:LacI family DNA-binding transcriptional regulator [Petroclostridium xylanilyticum]|uniref:LacI family DNA-binding transcriptional regulator n=1 Tax=Petroclostridium xylanilyticum TaxID=1792311 RepID=UPI000B983A8C|nr:LacI family DNA-binding transcriptional regulator [Petroclostridium xylanilyticum]